MSDNFTRKEVIIQSQDGKFQREFRSDNLRYLVSVPEYGKYLLRYRVMNNFVRTISQINVKDGSDIICEYKPITLSVSIKNAPDEWGKSGGMIYLMNRQSELQNNFSGTRVNVRNEFEIDLTNTPDIFIKHYNLIGIESDGKLITYDLDMIKSLKWTLEFGNDTGLPVKLDSSKQ